MTLLAFQRALCELIASPELCLRVREDPRSFLSSYDLSTRERERLTDIVWQRGMSTNCTLYRSNRVTPIYTLLHYTCVALGDRLPSTLDAYWAATHLRDLEFKQEIHRFGRFLDQQIEQGAILDPFVAEVLEFELALNDLRFAPRREILRQLRQPPGDAPRPQDLEMHPLTRVVRFQHEPAVLLDALAQGHLPRQLPRAESFLLLSVVDEAVTVSALEPESGSRLWHRQRERTSHAAVS
jgi:hypothetical protein